MLYQNSHRLLQKMADAGNMASRGHKRSLSELERICEVILTQQQSLESDAMAFPDIEVDVNQWLAMLDASPSNWTMTM